MKAPGSSDLKENGRGPVLVPEWIEPQGIVMVWPEFGSKKAKNLVRAEFSSILRRIAIRVPVTLLVHHGSEHMVQGNLESTSSVKIVTIAYKPDIWIRDWGPLRAKTHNGSPVYFFGRYAPAYHGGKSSMNAPEREIQKAHSWFGNPAVSLPLVWDMGNIAFNGCGDILVTRQLLIDNSLSQEDELQSILAESFHLKRLIVLPLEPGDVTCHTDGFLRFVDDRTVAVAHYERNRPYTHFRQTVVSCLLEKDFEVIDIPCDEPSSRSRGGVPSAYGNRLNWIRVGESVLMPGYGTAGDERAIASLESQGLEVEVVPAAEFTEISHCGGILHCITTEL